MFEIIVGNVGSVYNGTNKSKAEDGFNEYVKISKQGRGRAGGEMVDFYQDGDLINQYVPIASLYDNGECPDCGEDIPYDAEDGQSCENCEHVFTVNRSIED